MPALPRVPTVQLWHSEVPTLAKVILPDAVQRMDHELFGRYCARRTLARFPRFNAPVAGHRYVGYVISRRIGED
jgi:hypothetical protein